MGRLRCTSERSDHHVRQFGHRPIPHLTARRYRNPEQLAETLQFLSDEGAAREALILAGDAEPVGSLKDSLDVVDSGVLEQSGLERIWFSGYPEGHPKISEERLASAWNRKLEWSRSCRIPIGVVTQLAKDPETSAEWCREQGFAEQGVEARISQFLFARPEILTDLAQLAGGSGVGRRLLRPRPGRNGGARAAAALRAPLHGLGRLGPDHCGIDRTFWGRGGLTLISRMAAMLVVAENLRRPQWDNHSRQT